MITVRYKAVDGFSKSRKFKTLEGARKFAHRYVGEAPELGSYYAVSDDGVGRIMVDGATLRDLFPRLAYRDVNPDQAHDLVKAGKFAIMLCVPRYDNRDAIIGSTTYVHGIYDTRPEFERAWAEMQDNEDAYPLTPDQFKAPTPVEPVSDDDIPF